MVIILKWMLNFPNGQNYQVLNIAHCLAIHQWTWAKLKNNFACK